MNAPSEAAARSGEGEDIPLPPAPPRPISNRYVWRLLSTDGGWIVALVFGLLGTIFSCVGVGLVLGGITAFLGLVFLPLGLAFLAGGLVVFSWRYQKAQRIAGVLRDGESTIGQVSEVVENYSLMINGRHPWDIRYDYQVNGQPFSGNVTTYQTPGSLLEVGKAVRVLYLPSEPALSSIYPHP